MIGVLGFIADEFWLELAEARSAVWKAVEVFERTCYS